MSEKVNNSPEETVSVTVQLPKKVYKFYEALSKVYERKMEDILTEELVVDIKGFTSTEAEKILIGAFELEQYVQ